MVRDATAVTRWSHRSLNVLRPAGRPEKLGDNQRKMDRMNALESRQVEEKVTKGKSPAAGEGEGRSV